MTRPAPRPARTPAYRLCVVETVSGRVVADLPFTGNPGWGRALNAPGALANVTIPLSPRLDDGVLAYFDQDWRYSLIYAYGGIILQWGIITGWGCDDTTKPAVLTPTTITLWDFFNRKRIVYYYSKRIDDPTGNVVFAANSPDTANRLLSWGSVGRRIVEIATGGPGYAGPGATNDPLAGLALPLVLPSPVAGTAAITYAIADLAYVGQRLTELTQLDRGPEFEFSPEWTDDSQSYAQIRMRISDTRLGQLGYPWAFDYGKACQSFPVVQDGSNQTHLSIAKGQDNRQASSSSSPASGSLAWGYSQNITPVEPSAGWPWLITANTAHSSETNNAVLGAYADADVRQNELPIRTGTLIIRNDAKVNGHRTGSPTLDLLSVGDTAVVSITGRRHPKLADGLYGVRFLTMGAGPTQDTTAIPVQILGRAA